MQKGRDRGKAINAVGVALGVAVPGRPAPHALPIVRSQETEWTTKKE